MEKPSLIATGLVLSALVNSNSNCSKNNSPGPAQAKFHVQLQSAGVGTYLVDKKRPRRRLQIPDLSTASKSRYTS
jgi:hypothetical protein